MSAPGCKGRWLTDFCLIPSFYTPSSTGFQRETLSEGPGKCVHFGVWAPPPHSGLLWASVFLCATKRPRLMLSDSEGTAGTTQRWQKGAVGQARQDHQKCDPWLLLLIAQNSIWKQSCLVKAWGPTRASFQSCPPAAVALILWWDPGPQWPHPACSSPHLCSRLWALAWNWQRWTGRHQSARARVWTSSKSSSSFFFLPGRQMLPRVHPGGEDSNFVLFSSTWSYERQGGEQGMRGDAPMPDLSRTMLWTQSCGSSLYQS